MFGRITLAAMLLGGTALAQPVGPITHGEIGKSGGPAPDSFIPLGGTATRALTDKASEHLSLFDFGGICDGGSHPLSALGYTTLSAAQQQGYPTAVALTDEADTAALTAAAASGRDFSIRGACLLKRPMTITTKGQTFGGHDRTRDVLLIDSTFQGGSAPGVIDIETGETGPHIHDLGLSFAQPDTAVRANLVSYPPAIYNNAAPRSIFERIRMVGGIDGLVLAGNSGGAYADMIETGMFGKNISIDGAADAVRISRPHAFPFALTANQLAIFTSPASGAVGLWSGRCDDLIVTQGLYFIGTSMHMAATASGVTFGSVTDTDFDTFGGYIQDAGLMQLTGDRWTLGQGAAFAIQHNGGNLTVDNPHVEVSTIPTAAYTAGVISANGHANDQFSIIGGALVEADTLQVPLIWQHNTDGVLAVSGTTIRTDGNLATVQSEIILAGQATVTGLVHNPLTAGSSPQAILVASANALVTGNNMGGRGITASISPTASAIGGNFNTGGQDFSGATLAGAVHEMRLTGTTSATGALTIPHGIGSGQLRIEGVDVYYKGASGEAERWVGAYYVDSSNFGIQAGQGLASTRYRVVLRYVDTNDAW